MNPAEEEQKGEKILPAQSTHIPPILLKIPNRYCSTMLSSSVERLKRPFSGMRQFSRSLESYRRSRGVKE